MGIFDDFLAAHPISQAEVVEDVEVEIREGAKKSLLNSVPSKYVEDVDGNDPRDGGNNCFYGKIVKKAFTSLARDQHSQHISKSLKSLEPRTAPIKTLHQHPQHLKKSTSWMSMPFLCGGAQCDLAYLPSSGGLVCGLHHQPVLMMSACPAGKWDRGFAVFAGGRQRSSQGNGGEK